MLRKILAFLLVITMLIVGIPTTASAQTEETTEDTTIIETSDRVVAQQEVNDCIVQYEYLKESEESFLSIGSERYELEVEITDDVILTSISDECENTYESEVVAQEIGVATVAAGLFTATVIYAAKDVIIAGISAVVDLGNSAIEVSVDAISRTINKIRSGKLTTSNVTAKSTIKRKAAIKAITKIKTAKKSNQDCYFAARLVKGTVYISYQLSYSKAVQRLKSGYDVFASSSIAASKVAKAASPRKRSEPHTAHISSEGYYPHFHPTGVKWKYNSNHKPHCWYST